MLRVTVYMRESWHTAIGEEDFLQKEELGKLMTNINFQ